MARFSIKEAEKDDDKHMYVFHIEQGRKKMDIVMEKSDIRHLIGYLDNSIYD